MIPPQPLRGSVFAGAAIYLRPCHFFLQVMGAVFYFAPGILDFAFGLVHGTFALKFLVTGPFAGLAFDPALDVIGFAFDIVLIHARLLLGFSLNQRASATDQLEDQGNNRQYE